MNQDNVVRQPSAKSYEEPCLEGPRGTQITMHVRCKETGELLKVVRHKQTIRHISEFEVYTKERAEDS